MKRNVPDYHFLLNYVADGFAERAAKAAELEMNVVSGVLWYSSLVQKIQRRMVRVIISLVQKATYDKKHRTPKPQTPTLDDIIQASHHHLVESGLSFRCLQCSGSVSRHSPNLKNWLKAKCDVAQYDDSEKHVPIPSWHLVQIGNCIPHVSHELFSLKGIIFCMKCGSFGAKKCRLLAHECRKFCTVNSQVALDRLTHGQLPVASMSWPRLSGLRRQAPTPSEPDVQATSHFDDPEPFLPLDYEAHAASSSA